MMKEAGQHNIPNVKDPSRRVGRGERNDYCKANALALVCVRVRAVGIIRNTP
jgi:hypothetical protein